MDTKPEITLHNPPTTLLSLSAVIRMTTRSRSAIYRDVERGTFPAPLKLGPRSNAWRLEDIEAWIAGLPQRKIGAEGP